MAGQAILPPGEAGGGASRVTVTGGEVGVRAEPAGDTRSSTTLGRMSIWNQHLWQKVVAAGEAPAPEWVTGSCSICRLSLTADHLTSLQ